MTKHESDLGKWDVEELQEELTHQAENISVASQLGITSPEIHERVGDYTQLLREEIHNRLKQ